MDPIDHHHPEAQPRTLDHDQQARVIDELVVPGALDTIVKVGYGVSPPGTKKYLENFTADAGNPTDPIERLMIEQLVLAHHRIARLHARSAEATDMRAVQIFGDLASRLLAEFRRLAMSLHEYRTPVQGRTTTVIHKVEQLNQAQGDQAVSFKTTSQGGSQLIAQDTELVGTTAPPPLTQEQVDDLHEQRERQIEESAAGRGRQAQPCPAGAAD